MMLDEAGASIEPACALVRGTDIEPKEALAAQPGVLFGAGQQRQGDAAPVLSPPISHVRSVIVAITWSSAVATSIPRSALVPWRRHASAIASTPREAPRAPKAAPNLSAKASRWSPRIG